MIPNSNAGAHVIAAKAGLTDFAIIGMPTEERVTP